jgi:hypothetical protein
MNNHFWHATLVVFTVMLPILTIGYARAHDHEHPELNSWYESLHSGEGLCCDGTDAKRVDDADWEHPSVKPFTETEFNGIGGSANLCQA